MKNLLELTDDEIIAKSNGRIHRIDSEFINEFNPNPDDIENCYYAIFDGCNYQYYDFISYLNLN